MGDEGGRTFDAFADAFDGGVRGWKSKPNLTYVGEKGKHLSQCGYSTLVWSKTTPTIREARR